jgi:hypothetical protein
VITPREQERPYVNDLYTGNRPDKRWPCCRARVYSGAAFAGLWIPAILTVRVP